MGSNDGVIEGAWRISALIEGCRNGDPAVQRKLYELYSPRFYSLCRRYSVDDNDAEDILVEGFMKVFQKIENYRGEGSFEGWMHTIFVRQIVHQFHNKKRHSTEHIEDERESLLADTGKDLDLQIDVRDAMVKALRRLPEQQRVVFNLVAVEEYTLLDAANYLDIPESTAKSQFYKARESIKKYLRLFLGKRYMTIFDENN